MKIAYKLTDSKMRTYNGFQWELGKCVEVLGEGKLCSPGWFHFYNDPLVGMFMNPAHANIKNPRLFRAEVEGNFIDDNGLKCGYSRARLIEELPVPQISPVQRVRFAIFCVKEVYKEKKWNEWADKWLSGKDRTIITFWSTDCTESEISAVDATNAALAAYAICADNIFGEARSAAIVAYTAQSAAESAASAAKSVASATESAASAAFAAKITTENKKIDLIRIARKAMEE